MYDLAEAEHLTDRMLSDAEKWWNQMKWRTLEAGLSQQELEEAGRRYHFDVNKMPEFITNYKKLQPMIHAVGCYRIIDQNGKKPDKDSFSLCGNEKGMAAAVITLGKAFDDYQDSCLRKQDIDKAYQIECLGMEILTKAYCSFNLFLHEELNLWPGEYRYPGSNFALEQTTLILEILSQKQVSCNSAYVMNPRKSVAFVVPLYEEQMQNAQTCEKCDNVNCLYRKNTESEQDSCQNGLIHVYTGEGKGKTTAAVGLAVRAAGAGQKVVFAQFMKSSDTSELHALCLIPQIRIIRSETDLGWLDLKDEKRTAVFAKVQGQILEQVRQCVLKRECDILILDEITYPYSYGLIDRNTLKEMIQNKPRNMELVLTGRDADPFFMEQADYITEMKCISHPYEKGIDARRGIEF